MASTFTRVESATDTRAQRSRLIAGGALLIGAALMAVKSVAILITGDQPPLLFEISPFFLGLGVLFLPPALELGRNKKAVVASLGAISIVAGAVAAVTEVVGEVLGGALAVASLTAIAGAVVGGWRPNGDPRKRALVLVGISVVPAMLVGGALAEMDERLLEIGLLGYAAVWGLAGFRVMTNSRADAT